MTLQERFTQDFKDMEYISTKDIFEWYTTVKRGDNPHTYRAAIYSLVINPLLMKGQLKKMGKGVYSLRVDCKYVNKDLTEEVLCQEQELDDFDRYIQEKIKGGV